MTGDGSMTVSQAGASTGTGASRACPCCGHRIWMYKGRWYLWHNGQNIRHARYIMGVRSRGERPNEDVHHKDGNASNDARENLEWKPKKRHRQDHGRAQIVSPETRAKISRSLMGNVPWNKNPQLVVCERCGAQRMLARSTAAQQRFCSRRCKAEKQRAKPQCIAGHLYTNDNTYVGPDGKRQCRICMKERSRRFYVRTRERMERNGERDTYSS